MKIQANCFSCGRVEVTERDVTLLSGVGQTWYEFACPLCRQNVRKPAGENEVRVLQMARIRFRDAYPERIPGGLSPLQSQDLLTFHELLATEDWFDLLFELTDLTAEDG